MYVFDSLLNANYTATMPSTHIPHSTTFTQPSLDGSLCIPALVDWQGVHSPKHPLFVFEDARGSLRKILWEEATQGIHRATEHIRHVLNLNRDSLEKPLIAILSSSGMYIVSHERL